MFGLLRVPKGYLSEDEFKVFQAHYCGICHALGRCGFQGLRMATSYDGTALAMFVSGLSGKQIAIEHKPCLFSPWRKKHQAVGAHDVFDFTARASLALVRLKAEDELLDGAGPIKQNLLKALVKYLKKKVPDWPELNEVGDLQREVEGRGDPWFDELAYPSGVLLGSIAARAAAANGKDEKLAYKVGANLGKWIYVWDALWDYEDDWKKGRFNALSAAYKPGVAQVKELEPELISEVDFVLERCLEEVTNNLQSLNLGTNGEILAKLVRGAHKWHKGVFVKEFFIEEGIAYERLPSTWQPCSWEKPASIGSGTGSQD